MAQTTDAARASQERLPVFPNAYEIDWFEAGKAGFLATLFFSAIYAPIYLAYRTDSMDIPLILGSTVTLDEWLARIIGFGIHLGIGIGIALSYAVILWLFNWQGNAGKGTVFGILVFVPMFAFFVPWFIGWLPKFAPTGVVHQPFDVMMNQVGHGNNGWELSALVMLAHMMFGLMLGAIYRHKVKNPGTFRLEYAGG
jgi:hypothetical protein